MTIVHAYPETVCVLCLRHLSNGGLVTECGRAHQLCDPTALQAAAAARAMKSSELVRRIANEQTFGARTMYQRYLDEACAIELDYRLPQGKR